MQKIGLTGNIGSGKTTVAKVFETLGVPVFYSDIEAKKLYSSHNVIVKVIETFGDNILDKNNKIDFKKLAEIVFNSADNLSKLNQIIHPILFDKFQEWASQFPDKPYVIMEAAVIFENNLEKYFDKIIFVTAPQDIRIQRVIERDKVSKEMVLKRIENQWTEEEKTCKSDYIIENYDNHAVIPQILEIHKTLLKEK